jgi:hypothetical protein
MRLSGADIRRANCSPVMIGPTVLHLEDGAIQVDAAVVAQGLGVHPDFLLECMRDGRVTSLCETGSGEDSGRFRLTFFSENRRFRLVADQSGAILQRTTIDFGDRPLAGGMRRLGR